MNRKGGGQVRGCPESEHGDFARRISLLENNPDDDLQAGLDNHAKGADARHRYADVEQPVLRWTRSCHHAGGDLVNPLVGRSADAEDVDVAGKEGRES